MREWLIVAVASVLIAILISLIGGKGGRRPARPSRRTVDPDGAPVYFPYDAQDSTTHSHSCHDSGGYDGGGDSGGFGGDCGGGH